MLVNIWQKVELYCSNHAEPQKMELVSINGRIYVKCPYGDATKYREEELCKTQLTLNDAEKVFAHIEKVIVDAELDDTVVCLTDYTFTLGRNKYKVFEHDDKIKITKIG